MNRTILWVIVAILILVVGGVLIAQNTGEEDLRESVNINTTEDTNTGATTTSNPSVKSITVTGTNVTFDVKEIRVNEGDTVRLTFVNAEGSHDWRIDEFKAGTKVLKEEEQETIEFVADKKGTFEYYCSVGLHRQFGMKGNLIVE